MASKAIRNDLYRGAWSVVEIDFRSYFTTIPHDKLMILIKQRVVDGSILRLIKQSLTVGIAYEGKVEPTRVGVPQGRSTAISTSTCWIKYGIGEAIRRNWGPRCIAMRMMEFWFVARTQGKLFRHLKGLR